MADSSNGWWSMEMNGCWTWSRSCNPEGYGLHYEPGSKRATYAHRLVYEGCIGPIPAGYSLDHLCRNHSCVNPAHLEPVTHRENVLRGESPAARHATKTHCQHGHEFTPRNTRIRVGTRTRVCRHCDRDRKVRASTTAPLTPERRSKIAKNAALARWSR
jgi:hypothetical protein